ncbi:MAG TPA: hypothetical protein VGQ76_05475 [Thermoanaerobaculia bacterium]|jgi:hypothetical protein|nr:hypothetical protein [Thermoanaerobaculia bacterium]
MLNKKAIITTPFPTPDEIAELYGITPKRRAELDQMLVEIRLEDAKKKTGPAAAAKRAAKKK